MFAPCDAQPPPSHSRVRRCTANHTHECVGAHRASQATPAQPEARVKTRGYESTWEDFRFVKLPMHVRQRVSSRRLCNSRPSEVEEPDRGRLLKGLRKSRTVGDDDFDIAVGCLLGAPWSHIREQRRCEIHRGFAAAFHEAWESSCCACSPTPLQPRSSEYTIDFLLRIVC